jgi:hypothetical protein
MFADVLDEIHTSLMSGPLRSGALRQPPQKAFNSFQTSLFPGNPKKVSTRRNPFGQQSQNDGDEPWGESDIALEMGKQSDLNTLHAVIGESDDQIYDDGMSVITADDYVYFRLFPAIKEYAARTPTLSLKSNLLASMVYLGTLSAALLSLVDLNVWVPIVVAFVALVNIITETSQVNQRLLVTNEALTSLRNTKIWWQSLSMVQQRLPINKENLVEITEAAIEAERSAFMKSIAQRKRHDGDEDKDDDD